jgi:hypothetical protein
LHQAIFFLSLLWREKKEKKEEREGHAFETKVEAYYCPYLTFMKILGYLNSQCVTYNDQEIWQTEARFTLYKQRVSMALQHVQGISILRSDVALGEGSSKLGLHSGGPSLSLFDMLLSREKGLET